MASRYTPSGFIDEQMSGITYLNTVKQLLDDAENDWPKFLGRLEKMYQTILNAKTCRDGMFVDITGEAAPADFRLFGQRLKELQQPSVAVVSSKAALESAAEAGKQMNLINVV